MSKYLVFGHKNPDTDAIGSAIAYAYLLNQQGVEAEAVALGDPNAETAYALNQFGLEAPRVVKTVANEVDQVALVDHNEPLQSADDIADVQVDYVVDHHRISGFETAQPLYYRCEPIGCTSSILYKLYKEQGVEIPREIAGIMLSAIISDSLLFKSPTCTEEDIAIADQLAKIVDIDPQEYGLKMLKAGANFGDKSEADLINGDAKNFDMNGAAVRIGQVNTVGFEEAHERKAAFIQAMQEEAVEHGYDVFLVVITDIVDSDSIGYVIGSKLEAVEAAFQQKVIDHEIQLPGVVSRKKQIVPQLTEAFEEE